MGGHVLATQLTREELQGPLVFVSNANMGLLAIGLITAKLLAKGYDGAIKRLSFTEGVEWRSTYSRRMGHIRQYIFVVFRLTVTSVDIGMTTIRVFPNSRYSKLLTYDNTQSIWIYSKVVVT
uniref:Uncharacterized protein n=1 Tax=Glossina palpalis gambiensis TaxID=67801 RepID=A0A1B0B4T1_9MUSC